MKKIKLVLMALFPVLIGWLYNHFIFISLVRYVGPLILIIYWFWVGMNFEENIKNPIKAIVLGNSVGIISFIIYYWQFIILSEQNRNLGLAIFSQMFFVPLSPIIGKTAVLIGRSFEKAPNKITGTTFLVMEIVGLILMILVFFCGYSFRKYNSRK